jgi:hypothetical protein
MTVKAVMDDKDDPAPQRRIEISAKGINLFIRLEDYPEFMQAMCDAAIEHGYRY